MRMHNPPHPSKALRGELLGDLTVTEAASRLGGTCCFVPHIKWLSGISDDVALRLRDALGICAEMWIDMQSQYDLW